MTTVIKGKVHITVDETGKKHIKRVYVMDASKRRRIEAQAKRTEAKLKDKRK